MNEDVVAVLDANVLYPFYLREFFMRLSKQAELFQAKWTNEINDEWTRNLIANKPHLSKKEIKQTVFWMNQTIEDALIHPTEHLQFVKGLDLPDPRDGHVIAAAIAANASFIVTKNLKDFPAKILNRFGVEAIHPDNFVLRFESFSTELLAIIIKMSNQYTNPSMSPHDVLSRLANEIPKTCAKILAILDE